MVGVTWLMTLDGSSRPWVLGNMNYEAAKLERWENSSERRLF
jgi:hypothetical protein